MQGIGLACLPVLSYAYVYIRGVQHPEWRGAGQWATAGQWFVQFLTVQQGRDELAPGLTLQTFFTAEFPALMWQELTWPIFLGGLLGLAFLARRRAIFLYSTLFIYFIFAWGYRFGNWFQVVIPVYPIFIIGVAAGLSRIGERLEPARAGGRAKAGRHWAAVLYPAAVGLLLSGLLVYRFSTSLPEANQRSRTGDTGLDPGWAILADKPTSPAVISGVFAERVALQYLGIVWGAAPSIYPTDAGDLQPPAAVGDRSVLTYITRRAAAAGPEAIRPGEMHPQAAGVQ